MQVFTDSTGNAFLSSEIGSMPDGTYTVAGKPFVTLFIKGVDYVLIGSFGRKVPESIVDEVRESLSCYGSLNFYEIGRSADDFIRNNF